MGSEITVVVPAYNAARYIDETMRSIFAQTLKPEEIIVVDDASVDDTVAHVKAYGDAVKLIRCAKNSGGCGTPRNIGIEAARTRLIVPFDSDDLMHPEKLRRHTDTLSACPEAEMCFSDFVWFDTPPEVKVVPHCSCHMVFKPHLEYRGDDLWLLKQPDAFRSLMYDNYIGASSLMFTKNAWKQVGGYDEHLKSAEDLEFHLRLSEHFSFGYVDEALYYYRIHPNSMSANKRKILLHAVKVLSPYLPKGPDAAARRALRKQLGEMEVDLTWHSIDQHLFGEAVHYWWAALKHGGLRHKLIWLTAKLCVHWGLTTERRWLRRMRPSPPDKLQTQKN